MTLESEQEEGGKPVAEYRSLPEYQDLDEVDEDLARQKAELLDQLDALVASKPELMKYLSSSPDQDADSNASNSQATN